MSGLGHPGVSEGTTTIRAYCTCGAALTVSASPREDAERVLTMFRHLHLDADHRPCDAMTARRARDKAARAERP